MKFLSEKFQAHDSNLKHIRDFICDSLLKLDCDSSATNLLEIAANEVCQNIIRYGYGYSDKGEIEVGVGCSGSQVRVTIKDNARSFDMNKYKTLDKNEIVEKGIKGKLGISMIRAACDNVEYNVKNDCNETVLVKNLS